MARASTKAAKILSKVAELGCLVASPDAGSATAKSLGQPTVANS